MGNFATADAQDKGLKKFRWGVTSVSASQWIPWIAKDAKLYENTAWRPSSYCCADRDNRRRRSSATAFSALLHIDHGDERGFERRDIVTVAHTVAGVQSKLLVRPEIKKPEDLRGKSLRFRASALWEIFLSATS